MADDDSNTPRELEQTKPGSDVSPAEDATALEDPPPPPPPPPPSRAPDATKPAAVDDSREAKGDVGDEGQHASVAHPDAESAPHPDPEVEDAGAAPVAAADDNAAPGNGAEDPAHAAAEESEPGTGAQDDSANKDGKPTDDSPAAATAATSDDAGATDGEGATDEPKSAAASEKADDAPTGTTTEAVADADHADKADHDTPAGTDEAGEASGHDEGAVAMRSEDPLENLEDDGLFPCFMCARDFLLEELEGHYAECAPLYHAALDNLSGHPLCGLVSRNVPPEQPDWNQAEDYSQASEWRIWYKRETLRVLLSATVMCRGCGSRFVQRDIGAHFSTCTREAPSLSGSPIVVRYSPQRSR